MLFGVLLKHKTVNFYIFLRGLRIVYKIFFIHFYILLLSFIPSYGQVDNNTETTTPVPTNVETLTPVDPNNPITTEIENLPPLLPELGELKIKYLTESITHHDLFRLASFYLSEQLYHPAAELYGRFLELNIDDPIYKQRLATAFYNRALALFSLELYSSALPEFQEAYFYNDKLYDALRMIGTIHFLNQDKENSLAVWQQYLDANTTPSLERSAIENAVTLLSNPEFAFPEEKSEETPKSQDKSWPFLNPDIIPNPDSKYEKKRII